MAPRSVLLSEIVQQLFCRKKEVGMRCKMESSAEGKKMNLTNEEATSSVMGDPDVLARGG